MSDFREDKAEALCEKLETTLNRKLTVDEVRAVRSSVAVVDHPASVALDDGHRSSVFATTR